MRYFDITATEIAERYKTPVDPFKTPWRAFDPILEELLDRTLEIAISQQQT